MAQVIPVSIPVSKDIETLRKHVVVNLTNLAVRLGQSDTRTAVMNMGGNRIVNVPDPVNALDAVNLRTLKKNLQAISHPRMREIPANVYTIVWSFYGQVTTTSTAPAYIINPNRTGTPVVAKIYAIGTGTGSTTMNIYYAQGGTGTPSKVLTADIILPTSAKGPVSESTFNLSATLSVNDVLYSVVSTAGGCTNLTLELLIQP